MSYVVAKLIIIGTIQCRVINQFHKITEEDAMKQATVTTFCIGEYTFICRQMVNHKIGRFYCICQILLITGNLIQFMSCSQEST